MPVANLVNNTVIPMGGAVTRRALIQDETGAVHHIRDYYHGGVFKQVKVRIDTRRRGTLIPDFKLPEWIKKKITTGPVSMRNLGTQPQLPIENPLNQTAQNAPVGTQGVLALPIARRYVAVFGRPSVVRTIGGAAPGAGPGARPVRFRAGG